MEDSMLSIRLLKLLLSAETEDLKREIDQIERTPQLTEQLKEMKTEIKRLEKENEELKQKSQLIHRDNSGHQYTEKKLLKTEKELEKMRVELEDAKKRLSQLMGSKMTDNNPAIADLSDANRPQILAQRYSELYDNQWTDAFDTLRERHFFKDYQTVAMLLKILMKVMTYCKREAAIHKRSITNALLMSEDEDFRLTSTQSKLVKEAMKATAPESGRRLFEKYRLTLGKEYDEVCALQVTPYLQECFSICWLMCVQDPPVVFGPLPRQNEAFDKNEYKEYTRSGTRVDYLVWPVMLLHQEGPVLCKGVAQCKRSHDPIVTKPRGAWEPTSNNSYSEKHEDRILIRDVRAETRNQYVQNKYVNKHDEFAQLLKDFLFYIQYIGHGKAKEKLGNENYYLCKQYCVENGLIER